MDLKNQEELSLYQCLSTHYPIYYTQDFTNYHGVNVLQDLIKTHTQTMYE